ncbi:TonB-dependent receptor [Telluria beijingensis]|uniref:TonB-dependent receptor n=1 Tax=Telluria beijingensis TaxID=3068633 RepID=UPI0027953DD3|nr:TonB-dependent receptor [Massilia sp. REN29]
MITRSSQGWRLAAPKPTTLAAVLAGAGLLGASLALAQEAPQPPAAASAAPVPTIPQADVAPAQTVIVTGTVGATEAKRANVSYTVMDAKDLGKFTPMSADDYLRDMPGVVVESNDSVARNESYTRGMSVGTGSPTAGNFWTTILEDGLPVVAVKFNNFQDSNFYRADISTNRVESIRGGSTGTSVASSAGGVFNFLPGTIQPGAALQTRLGFEGENPHLSWKQVDGAFGWRNEAGDLRAGATGFWRTSTGAVDPGRPLNLGGQLKLRLQKMYSTEGGGGGSLSLTVKHLDDMNSWNGQFTRPVRGVLDPQRAPGFGDAPDMFFKGGAHVVPTDVVDGPGSTRFHDPEKGAQYRQDALWLKWDHDTGGRWSFNSAIKVQKSEVKLQQAFYGSNPVSLWNASTFQDTYSVNQGTGANTAANLNRMPGFYEIYDLASGKVRARIANNVGVSNGINYRTGAPCGAGAAASPAQCVVYNDLPNADFDLGGGLVNGVMVPASTSVANQDLVYMTNANLGNRTSKDVMLNFMANYEGDNYRLQAGLFAVQARQGLDTWFNGRGLSAFADGQVANLGTRFVTSGGTYQLSDAGGWGRVGGGYVDGLNPYRYRDRERDISPLFGASWSPGKWDLNGSYKGTLTLAKTHTLPYVTDPRANGADSRNYGGIDGDPTTWYDNQNYVHGKPVEATKRIYLKNWSASVGYNFTPNDKVYYRHSMAGNNINGILTRYQTQFNADNKPLFPQADLKQDEIAWVFGHGSVSGQLTLFRTELQLWQQQTPLDLDGSTYVVEYLDHYLTRGLEGSLRWRVTPRLTWLSSSMYSSARALAVGSFAAGSPGPQDDSLTTVSGIMARTPKWVLSNTFSYDWGDFQFHVRHRFMAKRKLDNNPVNRIYLPEQRNTDLSVQYVGIKNLRIALDVRNAFNNNYISNYDTMLPTVTGVTKNDIYQQLPESAGWVTVNSPRSFWLTARYDF